MTEPIPAQLDEWQALAEAATPGTWRVESNTALVWGAGKLCSDCPPVGYPTDKTRCLPCPRRAPKALDDVTDVVLAYKPKPKSEPAKKAEAENARLREALEEILGYDRQFIIDNETGNCGLGEDGYCATIARAILNGEKTK